MKTNLLFFLVLMLLMIVVSNPATAGNANFQSANLAKPHVSESTMLRDIPVGTVFRVERDIAITKEWIAYFQRGDQVNFDEMNKRGRYCEFLIDSAATSGKTFVPKGADLEVAAVVPNSDFVSIDFAKNSPIKSFDCGSSLFGGDDLNFTVKDLTDISGAALRPIAL
ncbi:MAG: hypothetical protein C5B49_03615 [Bdellovibrio sp.]|nr:MAG: hypothetical protein C5B49_03615 [Bdellovibrio sp.]